MGGFCPRGDFVQGDFVRGGFVQGDFVLEPVKLCIGSYKTCQDAIIVFLSSSLAKIPGDPKKYSCLSLMIKRKMHIKTEISKTEIFSDYQ